MSNKAVMSVSLREFHSTNDGPESKKRTGANTSPKRERVNQQIVSALPLTCRPSRSRLAGNRSDAWHNDVEQQTYGQPVRKLISTLFDSVDADKNRDLAACKFSVTAEEVIEAQLDEIEAEQVRCPLVPVPQPTET